MPRLEIKVAYFLTDCAERDRGQTLVAAGSHRWTHYWSPKFEGEQPPGVVEPMLRAGDALLFENRTWHTGGANLSGQIRKTLIYGYGYRWIRTKDDMTVQELWEKSDPIRRQMLGWGVNCNGHFTPTDDDVPLRGWLREHSPDEAK